MCSPWSPWSTVASAGSPAACRWWCWTSTSSVLLHGIVTSSPSMSLDFMMSSRRAVAVICSSVQTPPTTWRTRISSLSGAVEVCTSAACAQMWGHHQCTWATSPCSIDLRALPETVKVGRKCPGSFDLSTHCMIDFLHMRSCCSVNTPTKTSGIGAGKAADLSYWESAARMIAQACKVRSI